MASLSVGLGHASAGAQGISPSALTPPSFRAPALSATSNSGLKSPSAEPVANSDLTVTPGKVEVEGAFGSLATAARELARALEGRRVRAIDIYALVARIEALYTQAGFVLVRAVLPPQEVVDNGTLKISLIDGTIEAVDVSAVPEPVRRFVADEAGHLIGRHHVTLAEIERQLLLAGRGPGLRLKSTLAKGKTVGGVRLILEGEHNLATSSLGFDNRVSNELGRWRLKGSIALNSPLRLGEQIYVTTVTPANAATTAVDAWPQMIGAVGLNLPLGLNGLMFNPEYSRSQTSTHERPGAPATHGAFDRLAFRLMYPLVLTRASTLDLSFAAEHIHQVSNAVDFGIDLNEDDYWVVRAGSETRSVIGADLSVNANLSISRGLGGRDRAEAETSYVPLSRDGARPVFTKLSGEVSASKPLGSALRSDVAISAQHSFGHPLLRPEQFCLDGANALSAFDLGTFNVDSGATVRSELVAPTAGDWVGRQVAFEPYVFGAAGFGLLEKPSAVEKPTIQAYALGVGVRASVGQLLNKSAAQATLEVSKGYSSLELPPPDWRLATSLSASF